MKFVLLLLMFFMSTAFSMDEITDTGTHAELLKVIKSKGKVASKVTRAYRIGKSHDGLVFKVIVDDYELVYRVVMTPKGTFIVTPW